MDGALLVILVSVGVLVLGALVCAPLLLPWPQQVRWTVVAQAMGDTGPGPASYQPARFREVRLVSVDTRAGVLELGVLDVGHPARDALTFVGTTPPSRTVKALLDDWCALQTPMLLFVDAAGVASLTGPAATITNMVDATASAEPDASHDRAVSGVLALRLHQQFVEPIHGRETEAPWRAASAPED
jgi:hypothetical protein